MGLGFDYPPTLLAACKKKTEPTVAITTQVTPPKNITPALTGPLVSPITTMDYFSTINKTIPWKTNSTVMRIYLILILNFEKSFANIPRNLYFFRI